MGLVAEARIFAAIAHAGQRYGEFDYVFHLDQVADIVSSADLDDEYLIAAYLHDVFEDTDAKFLDVGNVFGISVAVAVDAMSDDKSLKSRVMRKLEANQRFSEYRYDDGGLAEKIALMVKPCDRLAKRSVQSEHWQ